MKKTPIFVILFLLLIVPGLYFAKKLIPVMKNRIQQQTSDAKDLKGKITLAIDDWIGYYPLSSGRLKKTMRNEGYMLDISNDGGDYPARMKKLREGDVLLGSSPLVFLSTHTKFRPPPRYVTLPGLKEINNGAQGFLEI